MMKYYEKFVERSKRLRREEKEIARPEYIG